jgi:riboflavin biosynthesis pyrimidine reductase
VSKVLWHTVMSLDGNIAGPGGDMHWIFEVESGSRSRDTVEEVLASTGALLVGRRTQDIEDRDQPGFYGGRYQGPLPSRP